MSNDVPSVLLELERLRGMEKRWTEALSAERKKDESMYRTRQAEEMVETAGKAVRQAEFRLKLASLA